MKVVALIGASGTGKSHKALMVTFENDLDVIIDDGLLIQGARVLAGSSAKREPTKVSAVRRAIFMEEAHRDEVKHKLREVNPQGVLVLGTSRNMVIKICKALDLSMPERVIDISQISTDREMRLARGIREREGKHVIPVPTLEIKKQFSGYLLDPLKIFSRKSPEAQLTDEKSVVRPTFSYMGRYSISDTAIVSLVAHITAQIKGVVKPGRINVKSLAYGIVIDIDVAVAYGRPLRPVLTEVRAEVISKIEYITALNVLAANVTATKLVVPEETDKR
jgi:uncharacterized alkaline shock family protein YloU